MSKKTDAAARFSRLRRAGVHMTLSPREAWYLSGGIIGSTAGTEPARPGIPLARIAREVPDCEKFVNDYLAVSQGDDE